MFSPSQLIQSVVQRSPISTPKPVELTPGQVFKGTVIKQYPDNMALVQIGGMQVQAKMEANLEPGQKAWLQVQPTADVVTLKVLETASTGAGKEATLEGLMRSLGLPESKESRAIVSALLHANLPVNKETVQAFSAVAQRQGMDDATIEAFMLAAKRNLPLTHDTISGLKAFLSAKPIGQVMQQFQQQASLFLEADTAAPMPMGQAARQDQTNSSHLDLRQVVGQLKEKLAALPMTVAGEGTLAEADASLQAGSNKPAASPSAGQIATTTGTGSLQQAPAAMTQAKGTDSSAKQMLAGEQISLLKTTADGAVVQKEVAQSNGSQPSTGIGNQSVGTASGQIMNSRGMVVQEGASQSIIVIPNGGQPQPQRGVSLTRGESEKSIVDVPVKANSSAPANVQTTASASAPSNPIAELFRQLGVGHERNIMGQTLSGGSLDAGVHKQMESVKSLLLQITQAPPQTVPTALREAADQMLQQVTGQQLMMLQPPSQALSQIVLQIPIRSEQGEDTAFVQIESKKKDGGQVDAENCRLFFHLELQSMGTTMIDVSIVNRIVNLQIFNDTKWVESLVSGMKDSFSVQLQEVGYHLSAMRIQPVPDERSRMSGQAGAKRAALSDYKGVDLRV
ncbi:hypothetical protein [Brevibacillus sp. NRS-1366]|uniref:hypothetical protein n=1 Tax=Brevibacillus sp. NRS-1366 TaxID=3233899 RepID=UPI003D25142A